VLWQTGTQGHPGAYLSLEQDELALVAKTTLWDASLRHTPSDTGITPAQTVINDKLFAIDDTVYSPNRAYRLTLQTDGDLVLSKVGGAALMRTHTAGHPTTVVDFTGDFKLTRVGTGAGPAPIPLYEAAGTRLNESLWKRDGAGHWTPASPPYFSLDNAGRLTAFLPTVLWRTGSGPRRRSMPPSHEIVGGGFSHSDYPLVTKKTACAVPNEMWDLTLGVMSDPTSPCGGTIDNVFVVDSPGIEPRSLLICDQDDIHWDYEGPVVVKKPFDPHTFCASKMVVTRRPTARTPW
jgi:hypothetical protein